MPNYPVLSSLTHSGVQFEPGDEVKMTVEQATALQKMDPPVVGPQTEPAKVAKEPPAPEAEPEKVEAPAKKTAAKAKKKASKKK